jgi:hypothetical protein
LVGAGLAACGGAGAARSGATGVRTNDSAVANATARLETTHLFVMATFPSSEMDLARAQ